MLVQCRKVQLPEKKNVFSSNVCRKGRKWPQWGNRKYGDTAARILMSIHTPTVQRLKLHSVLKRGNSNSNFVCVLQSVDFICAKLTSVIGNYFDIRLIFKSLFQAKMQKSLWLQLLKCEDLLLFFIFSWGNWISLGFGFGLINYKLHFWKWWWKSSLVAVLKHWTLP